MIKLSKKIFLLMMIAANIIAGSGCSNIYSEKSVQLKGLKQMKKRYGNDVEFTIKSGGPALGGYDMYLTVVGKEEWDVRLSWYQEDRTYYDNYMSWVLREEVEAIYLPLINQVYEDCKAFNSPYGGQMSKLFTKNTTIDDYLNTVNTSAFDIFLYSDSSDREEKLNQLADLMKEHKLNINVTVLYVPKERLGEINQTNSQEIIDKSQYLLRGGYMTTKEGEDYFIDWREGKLK